MWTCQGWQRSGILGAIGPFLAKWGWDVSRGASFFCLVNHVTFRQLCSGRFSPNLVTKRISVSRRGIRKDILENFHFRGHLPPKSEIENWSNRHLTQSRLQVTWCTAEIYSLLHVVVQGPESFRDRSTFLYDVRLRSQSYQRCLKTCNSKDGCTFQPNIFAHIPQKPHFGGPFNAKPIIQIDLCKSHVNEATKVKLYSCIGIGKYLGCV